jgi:hypothetical protein
MPPGAEKYQTLEQMSEEIKGLDEVRGGGGEGEEGEKQVLGR